MTTTMAMTWTHDAAFVAVKGWGGGAAGSVTMTVFSTVYWDSTISLLTLLRYWEPRKT